jgi:AcrR family transcriptional regulator
MARKYDHLREKAISLRSEKQMTLDDIVERLSLPKTTVYYWIKDIPIPQTTRRTEAQRKATRSSQAKYAALREAAYQQGCDEAPTLLQDLSFRDFVVLYMAEGTKRARSRVEFVNSDVQMLKLAKRWITEFADESRVRYRMQYHADQDIVELKQYWANALKISPNDIVLMRKSNSGKLSGRQFRSEFGVLSINIGDTYLRARLQAWMDYVKSQWKQ